ncbi:FAD-dependent oxidoreductase [Brenneria uluponensis]|uniref:FAD-dependent oxidoreductase n=1 Tax=Brenneria uluponensis TaxID=3057057 RepID=UPI003CCC58FE
MVLKTGGTTIEHTNFDSLDNYKGTHIAYLSRYLAVEDPVWLYSDDEYFDFAMRHLKRMFPKIDESWVVEYKVWRSEYAQPVTERDYSSYIPARDTPFKNAFIPLIIEDA